jgi:antitoxin (DNA-binding transcriptional repressor) of toxin-antitoxin stability system
VIDEMHVSITQAKAQLEKLIARALGSEEIVICWRGQPMVRLEPIPAPRKRVRRVPGKLRGKLKATKNAFQPLSDKELHDLGFEG